MSEMKKLGIVMALMMASTPGYQDLAAPTQPQKSKRLPKPPHVPTGAKEYFFNEEGEFSTERMRRDECVFKCVAVNDKNAVKKFNNWKSKAI